MKNILRYTAALFCVVLALTACLPEEPVHESINMGAGEVTSLSSSAADLLCEIEDELPKYTKIEYGIIYSENQEKVENHKGVKKIEGRDLSENRFLVQLTDLKAKQEYFYSSYLRLDEGRIIYGDISSFVTKASYKVTFNANGGKGGMAPQHFEEDDNKALTENTFTREGHEFAGWNTKADGSGQYFHPQQAHQLTDNVNLFAQWQVVSGMEEGYTYVDLGLSVEWATRNVGAERREAYGDYFAWGETQTKNNYAWDSYQWGIASDLLTKYCVDAAHGKNGVTDAKTTLDLTDDAARVQWKGAWRMPTLAEQKELREKCTWKWKNLNGIAGYEVTGPSGKSIFLPAAGFKNNDALYQSGSYGCYWSSSLYEIQSDYAYYLNIIPSTREQGQYSRSYGYSVRPVYLTYYCVRFDANQGEGKMDSVMVKKTESLTIPANQFTRDGYIFTAWNTAPDGSGTKVADQSKFSPTSDTTFYAQWHKVWMLHFDANGGKYNGSGTTMPDQQFKDGEAQEIEANVYTREKHKFVCWNTKADGSGDSIADKQELLLTSDTTLYAQWHEWYTIKLHANGGSGSATTFNQLFEETVSNQLMDNPFSRSSYIFTGWNTKADGSGVSYDDKATITASSDMDLYAQWKAVYKLTFNGNGATSNMAPQTFYAGVAQQINKNTLTRSGYKFLAWNTKVDGTGTSYRDGDSILLNANMTLYAQWQVGIGTAQGYEYVDLGLPSGTKWATCNVGATQPYEYGDYFAWGEVSSKPKYSWDNYLMGAKNAIIKYCSDEYMGSNNFVDYVQILSPSDDAAQQAWGGNWRMPMIQEMEELQDNCTWTWTTLNGVNGYLVKGSNGASIFLPAAGSYDGADMYESGFAAYYWTSTLLSSNSNMAYALYFSQDEGNDYSYYMRYYGHSIRPIYTTNYSIIFDANGGTGTMEYIQVEKGQSTRLPYNNFSRENHYFSGWNTRADGKGELYMDNASILPESNILLYAQWKSGIVISFDANGGQGSMSNQIFDNKISGALNKNEFYRNGYDFIGWNTESDGSGISYTDEQLITMSVGNITLYAQWGMSVSGIHNSHSYVDLGLPSGLMWATYNIGATSPENRGAYYAWGEVSSKSVFSWDTYKYGTSTALTKYCHDSYNGLNGFVDYKYELDLEDDVAYDKWGGNWRMPTDAEQKELLDNCTWTWIKYGGVVGVIGISKINGKGIFLPTTGAIGQFGSSSNPELNILGCYASCSLSDNNSTEIAAFWFVDYQGKQKPGVGSGRPRFVGHAVRAVCGAKKPMMTITFDANGASGSMSPQQIRQGSSQRIKQNSFVRDGYYFGGWNTRADGSGTSYANNQEITLSQNTTLYAQWILLLSGTENGHDYVDLGLPSGTKWATCNIGATTPEDYGDYFAWGETSPKDNYDWSTYKYCNGSYTTLTKYNTKSNYGNNGFTDNKTTLELSDDAAHTNWGGKWRMPTITEQQELINNCTWTWTTQNGVNGYKVTSKINGESIFLPAASYRYGTSVGYVGEAGYYWSSSLDESYPDLAFDFWFFSLNVAWSSNGRHDGRPIRAVCP